MSIAAEQTSAPFLDVCICAHDPEPGKFLRVLTALANQTLAAHSWRLIVIDNNSSVPVQEDVFALLERRGINCNLVHEPAPGIINARRRAIAEVTAPWILFVDDDNILSEDYLEKGYNYANNHDYVGCFGGRLKLTPELRPADWLMPLLPLLAIKDYGDSEIVSWSEAWGPWMPPSAGLFIRNEVASRFIKQINGNLAYDSLGRRGRQLNSGLDYMMVRVAPQTGLACAYVPELELYHDLEPSRLTLGYMLRINWAYGRSHAIIRNIERNAGTDPRVRKQSLVLFICGIPIRIFKECAESPKYAFCRIAYRLGFIWQKAITFFAVRLPI